MEQKLLAENLALYLSTKDHPKVIRLRMRMRDLIHAPALEKAVCSTMKRYPYYCVKLERKDDGYYFIPNDKPVVINHLTAENAGIMSGENGNHASGGIELNSPASNDHLLVFSWHTNWIILDVFHGLTDGIGAYEIIRTLLYYYCSEQYQVLLSDHGIRTAGDIIPAEEWDDPAANITWPEPPDATEPASPLKGKRQPPRQAGDLPKALDLVLESHLENDRSPVVYSISVPESEFMRFNIAHDGSPGTMTALFLSRAIAAVHPQCEDAIRISLCVNQRNALESPAAHQSLVGNVLLEYKNVLRPWPLAKQATAFRGMVYAQTLPETILSGVKAQRDLGKRLLSATSDEERLAIAKAVSLKTIRRQTATVSYVGKSHFSEAERYIRDFRTWACAEVPLMIEISAVNGLFTFDLIQHFSSPLYVNALLSELEEQNITYDLQDVKPLELATIRLPWKDCCN